VKPAIDRAALRLSIAHHRWQTSFLSWCEDAIFVEGGEKWSLIGHEYLRSIYSDKSKDIVILKSAQSGITTWAFLRAVWLMIYVIDKGVLYFFPNSSDATDFSNARVKALIRLNPVIQKHCRDVANVGLKSIGRGDIYFRGMNSTVAMKSIPCDVICYDEVDEASPDAVTLAGDRLSHSAHGITMSLSTPTIPSYGVDRLFQETDQHRWLIKCMACNRWNDLIDNFMIDPYSALRGFDGHYERVCLCGERVDIDTGQWVAKYPDRNKRGYHISQLLTPYVSGDTIIEKFKSAQILSRFYNGVIGVGWLSVSDRLTRVDVLSCCDTDPMSQSSTASCYMGVDVGSKLHVAILRPEGNRLRLVYCGGEPDFESITKLIERFSVQTVCFDALPETHKCRDFQSANEAAWIAYYNASGAVVTDEGRRVFRLPRTEVIDSVVKRVKDKGYIFPREEQCDELISHLLSLARVLEKNEETGDSKYVWIRTGDDHLAHALVYANAAMLVGDRKPFGF